MSPSPVFRPSIPAARRSRVRRLSSVLASWVLLALAAGPAAAHEYWLAPSRYKASTGLLVEVSALAGTGFRGEKKPFSSARCVRFVARAARTLDLARGAANGELVWARFSPVDEGGAMLAYESDFTRIELPADEFERYLTREGLDGPLAARRASGTRDPGRERYRRCPKTWLDGSDAARAREAFGLPLEIVPQAIPGREPALTVRVLYLGKPLAGVRVEAWRADSSARAPSDPVTRDTVGVAWQARTDAKGEAVVPVAAPGEWMISVVHVVPSTDRAAADWESSWASLTFIRAAPAHGSR